MALQRYLFLRDNTYPEDAVLRYEAAGEQDLAAAFRRLHPDAAATDLYTIARLTRTDPLDKKFWAVVDADLIHAKAEYLAHRDIWPEVPGSIPQQVQNFLAEGFSATDRFINYCDVPLAQAWLREARAQIVSARTGRPVYPYGETPQPYMEVYFRQGGIQRATVAAWQAFNNYLRALNLRPWGWARFRLALERALVKNTGVTITYRGSTATRPKPPPLLSLTGLGSEPFCAAPMSPQESAVGPWRTFYWRWLSQGGGWSADVVATDVVFGTPAASAGARHNLADPNDCLRLSTDGEGACVLTPVGNVPTIWLDNGGNVVVQGDSGTIGQTGMSYGFEESCNANLHCPAMLGSDGNTAYVASLLGWHLDMLDDLVTYCETKSPFEIVVEFRIDIAGKNEWTVNHFGSSVLGGANPATFLGQEATAVGDQERASTDQLIAVAATAVGTALSATPLGPFGALIGGAAGAVATFFNHIIDHTPEVRDYPADVYGRVEPAMETFQHSPLGAATSADRDRALRVMPPPPDGYYSEEEARQRYGWDPPVLATAVVPGVVAVPPVYRPMVTAANAPTVANVAKSASAGSRLAAVTGAALLAGAIAFSVAHARKRRRDAQLELPAQARTPAPAPDLPTPRRTRPSTAKAA